jgi:hypothetical protein
MVIWVHSASCVHLFFNYHLHLHLDDTSNTTRVGVHYLKRIMRPDMVQVRVLIECVFVWVVRESKTCHIYKVVLQIINTAASNSIKDIRISSHKILNQQNYTGYMIVTLRRVWTSLNHISSSSEIDLTIITLLPILSQISDDDTSTHLIQIIGMVL